MDVTSWRAWLSFLDQARREGLYWTGSNADATRNQCLKTLRNVLTRLGVATHHNVRFRPGRYAFAEKAVILNSILPRPSPEHKHVVWIDTEPVPIGNRYYCRRGLPKPRLLLRWSVESVAEARRRGIPCMWLPLLIPTVDVDRPLSSLPERSDTLLHPGISRPHRDAALARLAHVRIKSVWSISEAELAAEASRCCACVSLANDPRYTVMDVARVAKMLLLGKAPTLMIVEREGQCRVTEWDVLLKGSALVMPLDVAESCDLLRVAAYMRKRMPSGCVDPTQWFMCLMRFMHRRELMSMLH